MSKLKITKSLGNSYVHQYMKCPICDFFLATEEFDSKGGFGPKESYQYFRHCPLCNWREWELEIEGELPRIISKNPEKTQIEDAIFINNSLDNLDQEEKESIKDYLSNIMKLEDLDLKRTLLELVF